MNKMKDGVMIVNKAKLKFSKCFVLFCFVFFFFLIYDSHTEREREREREVETQVEGEAGSMNREPNVGLDPGSPGSRPGPKAGAKPLRHPGIPIACVLRGVFFNMGISSHSNTICWKKLCFIH